MKTYKVSVCVEEYDAEDDSFQEVKSIINVGPGFNIINQANRLRTALLLYYNDMEDIILRAINHEKNQ